MHSAQMNVFNIRHVNRLIPVFIHTWHIAYITTLFLNKQALLTSNLRINKESSDFYNIS